MRESRLHYDIICAEGRTASQFIWRSLWRGCGSPRPDDRVDDGAENNECKKAKEHREHMFIYPSMGAQVGVVEIIYYPWRGIHL